MSQAQVANEQKFVRHPESNSTLPEPINMKTSKRFFVYLLPLLVSLPVFAETTIFPTDLANQEGNQQSGDWPPASRSIAIFDTSAFATAISGPIRITSLSMRPDAAAAVGERFGFEDMTLLFSLTSAEPDDGSRNFQENRDAAVTVPLTVFDGAWEAAVLNPDPPGSDTRPFDFKVPFSTPFEFEPDDGNLLVEWIHGSPLANQAKADVASGTDYSDQYVAVEW